MKTILALLVLFAGLNAFADSATDSCDNQILAPKVAQSLKEAAAVVGGTIDASSVKTTPLIPQKYLVSGEQPLLASVIMTAPDQDGAPGVPGEFAAQFQVDYSTCTPKFMGMGRLQ